MFAVYASQLPLRELLPHKHLAGCSECHQMKGCLIQRRNLGVHLIASVMDMTDSYTISEQAGFTVSPTGGMGGGSGAADFLQVLAMTESA